MKIEKLKKSYLKRNLIMGIVAVLIISAVILNFTRAKYRTTQSIPLVNGTINYTPYDFKMVAMYQENENGEYENINTVPNSGYALNKDKSYCEVDGKKTNDTSMEYENGKVYIGINKKGTKCYLYFNKSKLLLSTEILNNKSVQTRTDFNVIFEENTNGIIYQAEDGKNISYYFAGNTSENWVRFGGFYWRIIRINGDGSIRLIYSGNIESGPTPQGENTQISSSEYNKYNTPDNMYVGFMYEEGNVHGAKEESNIKIILDNWYKENIADKGLGEYIKSDGAFCNDRYPSTSNSNSNGNGGTGTTPTYYTAYIKMYEKSNPSFNCTLEEDIFYTPVGLITLDEAIYAGQIISNNPTDNINYYLYTGQGYWTITPFMYINAMDYVSVLIVNSNGGISRSAVTSQRGIRPVINLRNDVTISSGDGTQTNPYIVN